MHSTRKENPIMSFSNLDPDARKNAISLNFQEFIKEKRIDFSRNHAHFKKEVEQIKKEWGLENLGFIINRDNDFRITPGTLSKDFMKTATCLLQSEDELEQMAIVEQTRDLKIWVQTLLQSDKPIAVNYQYKRESNFQIVQHLRVNGLNPDVYLAMETKFPNNYDLTGPEIKEKIRLLKTKATPEQKNKLKELEIKSMFKKEQSGGRQMDYRSILNLLTDQIYVEQEKNRLAGFERYLETKLKTWEQKMSTWLKQNDLRAELETFLEAHPEYTFDKHGWMKINHLHTR